jgi:hypothetical protein
MANKMEIFILSSYFKQQLKDNPSRQKQVFTADRENPFGKKQEYNAVLFCWY